MAKRFLTMALDFIVCMGLAVPAWAAEDSNIEFI